MKKLSMILTLVIALFAMVSCQPANSPEGVAKEAFKAIKDKDFAKMVELMGDKNGDALTENQKNQLKALFDSKVDKNSQQTLESYKILGVEYSDNKDKAVVNCEVKYEGKEAKEDKVQVIKGADGQWRLDIGK